MESEEDDGGIQLLMHLVHRWRTTESRGSEEHITTSVDANSSPNKIPANNMVAARPRAPPYPPPEVCGEQGGFVPTVFYGPPTYLESLLPEWVPGPPAYYHPLIDDESRYLNPIPSGDYRVVAVKSRESAVVDDRPAASQETASERAARVEKAHRAYEAQVAWAGYQPEHRSQDIEELD